MRDRRSLQLREWKWTVCADAQIFYFRPALQRKMNNNKVIRNNKRNSRRQNLIGVCLYIGEARISNSRCAIQFLCSTKNVAYFVFTVFYGLHGSSILRDYYGSDIKGATPGNCHTNRILLLFVALWLQNSFARW